MSCAATALISVSEYKAALFQFNSNKTARQFISLYSAGPDKIYNCQVSNGGW